MKFDQFDLDNSYPSSPFVDLDFMYGTLTKLWQSCSNPHLKIRPIAIFAFYSLNYSLAARLQDNSRLKPPTKVETKRQLQQFTVSGWLIIGGKTKRQLQQFTVSGWLIIRVTVKKENFKAEIIFSMKCPYNYQPLFA